MTGTAVPVHALTRWLRGQALLGLGSVVLVAFAPVRAVHLMPWIVGGIAASWVWLWLLLAARPTAANLATAARLAGLCLLLASGPASPMPTWPWFLAAVAVVVADLVDGALARRRGGSAGGAVLDMETDQFTVFGLAVAVVSIGGGRWVLVLPALRWWFVLAMTVVGRPAHDPKPKNGDNRRGRRICAAVMVALLLALCPIVPRALGDTATAVAVVLLVWSFAADARWLLTRRVA